MGGEKYFGLDDQTVMLIGAGSSICGAAAVMATEPVVKAQASQVAVAVSTVVILELSVFSSTHGFSILTLLRVGYLLVKKLLVSSLVQPYMKSLKLLRWVIQLVQMQKMQP